MISQLISRSLVRDNNLNFDYIETLFKHTKIFLRVVSLCQSQIDRADKNVLLDNTGR